MNTTYDLITVSGAFRVFLHTYVYNNIDMNILKSLLKEEFKFDDNNIKVDEGKMIIALTKRKRSAVFNDPFYSINSVFYEFFSDPGVTSRNSDYISRLNLEEHKKEDLKNYINSIVRGNASSISLLYTLSFPSEDTVNLIL